MVLVHLSESFAHRIFRLEKVKGVERTARVIRPMPMQQSPMPDSCLPVTRVEGP